MIPKSFEREIIGHIGRNILASKDRTLKMPLIECISGPPGMGKTYQTHDILRRMGVVVCDLPGSSFENESAGVPADMIYESYVKASKYWEKGLPAAIFIDDADAAIGQWGELTQYTVNRQLVCSTLMALADDPCVAYVRGEAGRGKVRTETRRVPIFMTCNDSTKMYPPLMRPGRTRTFVWNPSSDEIGDVVMGMFPYLQREEAEELIDAMDALYEERRPRCVSGAPVSLYSDIRSTVLDDAIFDSLEGLTVREMMGLTVEPGAILNARVDVRDLIDIGDRLVTPDLGFVRV